MIYSDYREGKVPNTIEVDIICSACKEIHTVIIDRVSKLTMSICPHCFNIDIEKTAGKIPVNAEKQLKELNDVAYSVNGKPLADFMSNLSILDEEQDFSDSQSYSGLYRLKSYYSRTKAKKQLDLNDFPTFEEFMRWSIKQGYRDWKTLKLDEHDKVSKQASWVPGGYSKNVDKALQLTTDCMSILHEAKEKLIKLLNTQEQTTVSADLVTINQLITASIRYINDCEANIANKI